MYAVIGTTEVLPRTPLSAKSTAIVFTKLKIRITKKLSEFFSQVSTANNISPNLKTQDLFIIKY
jgi:hypothetical protein